MEWFRLTLSPDPKLSPEEIDNGCASLVENGAAGTTIESNGRVLCFLRGDSNDAKRLTRCATNVGFTVSATEVVQEENWNRLCPEVWAPITAGTIKVVPVESIGDTTPADRNTIKIIPGSGFGTGHHPATHMILQTVSEMAPTLLSKPLSILDLGTGSGILAIAAAKLFECPVEAIDNDPLAISNAQDNVQLNRVSHLIKLSTTPVESFKSPFNLILANVYGEVLVKLAAEITRLAAPACVLILSGITEIVRDSVVETYTEKFGWTVRRERNEEGWCCITLERP